MDRGYKSLERLERFHLQGAFFVVRTFQSLDFSRSRSLPRSDPRVRSDQVGHPRNFRPRKLFPQLLRRIRFVDPDRDIELVFLTNLLDAQATDIARLYKYRWNIELFFKWIKQNLCIRRFFGASINAVQTQIWIAICVYLVVAILRKQLKLDASLHRILQVLSVTPFEKIPIYQLFSQTYPTLINHDFHNQLQFNNI
jgi:IS4 transposase